MSMNAPQRRGPSRPKEPDAGNPAFATRNLRPSKKEVLLAKAPAVCQQHNVVTELERNHRCLTEVLIETTWEHDLSLNN